MSENNRNEIFKSEDFEKIELVHDDIFVLTDFEKQGFNIVKIRLNWDVASNSDVDLDIAAVLLNRNGNVERYEDLVFFDAGMPRRKGFEDPETRRIPKYEDIDSKKHRRWKTKKPIGASDFDPLDGEISLLSEEIKHNISKENWKKQTLPISLDNSVIGSWDDLGEDEGGHEEQMYIRFREISGNYSSIAIVAAVSNKDIRKEKKFGDIYNPVITIIDANDNVELAEFKLNNDHPECDSICVGFVQFNPNKASWEFKASEKAYTGGMVAVANSFNR
ncbi:MAG: TerD family protein [Bacteroidaceae bacterium]|nr:TerD family protein [Bacteroidaceae bacterium]